MKNQAIDNSIKKMYLSVHVLSNKIVKTKNKREKAIIRAKIKLIYVNIRNLERIKNNKNKKVVS